MKIEEAWNNLFAQKNEEIRRLKKGIDTLHAKVQRITAERDSAERAWREQTTVVTRQRLEIQALQSELRSLGGTSVKS